MYKYEDFKRCVFNPLCDQPFLEAYPNTKEIVDELWMDMDNVDIEKELRYIIMVYDPNSPLILRERDLPGRRKAAFELLGITDATAQEVMANHSHPYMAELVTRFLATFIRTKEWAAICAFEYGYWESIKQLMSPLEGDNSKSILEAVQKKTAIKNEIEADMRRLDNYMRTFFGGDEDIMQKRERKRVRPEQYAQ